MEPQGSASQGRATIAGLVAEMEAIRAEVVADAGALQADLDQVHPNFRESARNLLHYLALRRRDLRPLQMRLAALGLSSLGRAEPHVLPTIDAVLGALKRLLPEPGEPSPDRPPVIDFEAGQGLLDAHATALLGEATPERHVRIMVTMPSEAAENETLVHDLLRQGMDCMRINCAHDDAAAWQHMIDNLRRAEAALGRSCRVVMDLGGPKLRTGPIELGSQVIKIRPQRDEFGCVVAPARIWLTAADAPQAAPSQASASLPVPAEWLAHVRAGDVLKFSDTRLAKRQWPVVEVTSQGCWAEADKTAYLCPGTELRCHRAKAEDESLVGVVGELPALPNLLFLQQGEILVITRDLQPGRPATRDPAGKVLEPATIGCTIPEVFEDVQAGESIWFDDGKIGAVVERVESARVLVRITHARWKGEKLAGDKGINLPDSKLRLSALTPQDLEDLKFVARHADVVELSFANCAHDVELLQRHLADLGARQPAIVLKIETRQSFENLPTLLLTAMRAACCGVMIARGDLAVECGFERLAEVQEEILWISEAAHVPVIWATQVLESLARDGMPSRAEITDAAMGHRAECVMLNKGPHMLSAVRVLDDIMRRMRAHQDKKKSMLRALRIAHGQPRE